MDNQNHNKDVKREATDVKSEAVDNENTENQGLQVNSNKTNTNVSEVQTVVLQNIALRENNGEVPILLNNFTSSNSDGNLRIDTIEENVIHTYIIE